MSRLEKSEYHYELFALPFYTQSFRNITTLIYYLKKKKLPQICADF